MSHRVFVQDVLEQVLSKRTLSALVGFWVNTRHPRFSCARTVLKQDYASVFYIVTGAMYTLQGEEATARWLWNTLQQITELIVETMPLVLTTHWSR